MITWRRLGPQDFPLLSEWLAHPHVARWWNHETSAKAVERDFGPAARGEEPSQDWLALLDDTPLGLMQRSRPADYPEDFAALSAIAAVPEDAVVIDYLIGPPDRIGRGSGPRMIRSFTEKTWRDCPQTPAIMAAVSAANTASWRALEKAGLRRFASGGMEPDNPADGPLHHVYRIDRPTGP